jgi:hypothetical protein
MTKPTYLQAFCRIAEANQAGVDAGLMQESRTNLCFSVADMTALAAEIRALQERVLDEARVAQALREELEALRLRTGPALVTPRAPGPDADGWIEWRGGTDKPPVDSSVVDVRTRCGVVISRLPIRGIRWRHESKSGDVVAYRVSRD